MTSYIKGALSYITPKGKEKDDSDVKSTTETNIGSQTSLNSINSTSTQSSTQPAQDEGYLKRAVKGVASGVYSVGSNTVGYGVSGVSWVAGTTYNVGSGIIGTAGTVVSAVGSKASGVASKITTSKPKEHSE